MGGWGEQGGLKRARVREANRQKCRVRQTDKVVGSKEANNEDRVYNEKMVR